MSYIEKAILKIYKPSYSEGKIANWTIRIGIWAFLFITIHLFHRYPIFEFNAFIILELLFLVYIILLIIFIKPGKISIVLQFSKLLIDFLFITIFEYFSLTVFGAHSWVYVLYIIPIIYCSFWFGYKFTIFFVTITSAIYCTLSFFILNRVGNLTNSIDFFNTLGPVVALYYLAASGAIFHKMKIRKERTIEIKHEKDFVEILLKSSFDAIMSVDETGKIVKANERAQELLLYSEKEIQNKDVNEIYKKNEAQKIMKRLRESKNGIVENVNTFIRSRNNEIIPIKLSASFLYGGKLGLKKELGEGNKFPTVGYFRDIRVEKAFNIISEEMSHNIDEKEMLNKICQIVSEIFRTETCSILLYNDKNGLLEVTSSFGIPSNLYQRNKFEKYKENEGMTGKVFYLGESLKFPNIDINNKEPKNLGIKWKYAAKFAKFSRFKDYKHFLGTPLVIQGEVYGVIRVLNKYCNENELDPNGFTDKDERQLEKISIQVSILVEKLRNKERFNSISKIGMKLNEKLDVPIDNMLGIITREVVIGMRFKACYLRLIEDGEILRINANYGLLGNYLGVEKYDLKVGEGISGKVAKTGKSECIEDLLKDKEYRLTDILKREKFRSMISVPLKFKEKVIGVINCYTGRIYQFNDQEIQIMQTFAAFVAIALRNANFINKLHRVTETFPKISELEKDIDVVLKKILQISAEVLDTNFLILYRYDNRNKEIIWPPIFTGDLNFPQLLKEKTYPSEIPRVIIEKGESYYAENSLKDDFMSSKELPARPGFENRFVKREDITSSAGIVLKVGKRTVGLMFINYRSYHNFNEDERKIIENYASYIALAIQNVIHFQEKENEHKKAIKAEKLTGIVHTAKFVAHNVRNELGTIEIYSNEISKKFKNRKEPYEKEMKIIRQCIDKLNNGISNLLQFSESPILNREQISFEKTFENLFNEMKDAAAIYEINFEIKLQKGLPLINLDIERIEESFTNLFKNSIEAMTGKGKITVQVFERDNYIIIIWSDTGTGLSSVNEDKIFELDFSTKGSWGLGLSFVKLIINSHGGKIFVDYNYKKGTRFIIELPLLD